MDICLYTSQEETNKKGVVQGKIAMLVPARNEEMVIEKTLESLLKLVPADDIYVVDDGSLDLTRTVALKYTNNVLSLTPNVGKATAMNTAIDKFGLIRKYEYLMPMDGDTIVTENFLEKMLPVLEADKDQKLVCVVGKVVGKGHNWATYYRLWEYEIAQTVHKAAQSIENAIIVCPGCSTIYRTSIFKKIDIPIGTLTEDMDFTFQIHRNKLGKISFVDKAFVVTQDPETLQDLLKQLNRWYAGFWQCVIKHDIPWGGQSLDFECALLATEGIINSFAVLIIVFLFPFVMLKKPGILFIPAAADLVFFMIPTLFLTAIRHKAWRIFIYLPQFYFFRVVSSLIFLKSFLNIFLGRDSSLRWGKAKRYALSY